MKCSECVDMQVTNHSVSRHLNESQTPINPGDVTPVVIKDRVSGKEANVVIKGREYRAEFEGSVPASDRMLAEVLGTPEKGKVILRQTEVPAAKAPENQSIENRLAKAGIDPAKNLDLKNAVKILEGKSIPLTKENIVVLQKFMNDTPGTPEEKLESVRVVAQKNLAVSAEHLKSIHNALHGQSLKDTLLKLVDGKELKFEAPRADGKSNPISVIKEARQVIQTEPDIQKAINLLKNKIVENPVIDQKTKADVEKSITEANRFTTIGQQGMAKGKLVQTLVIVEKRLQPEKMQLRIDNALKPEVIPQTKTLNVSQPLANTVEQAVHQIKRGENPVNEIEKILHAVERKGSADLPQLKEEIVKAKQVLGLSDNKVDVHRLNTQAANALKEVRQAIQKEPSIQKAINLVKTQIMENQGIDQKTKQQVEKAVADANKLSSFGQQGAAKEKLVQTVSELESKLLKAEESEVRSKTNSKMKFENIALSKSAGLPLSVEVEQAVQQIRDGGNPLKAIEKVLMAVEKHSSGSTLEFKQEMAKVQQVMDTFKKTVSEADFKLEPSKTPVIKDVRQAIQTEPNTQKAINYVKNQITESLEIDQKIKQQVERAVTEANKLLSLGQSGLAKGKLVQSLVALENTQATDEVPYVQSRMNTTPMNGVAASKSAESLQSIAKTVEQAVKQIKNGANPAAELRKILAAVEKKNTENHPQLRQEIGKAQQLLEVENHVINVKNTQLPQKDNGSAEIKQVRQTIQVEQNTQKAINIVKNQLLDNPVIDQNTKIQVEKAITDANKLLSMAQPSLAKAKLDQTLAALQNKQAIETLETQAKGISKTDNTLSNKSADMSLAKTVEQAVQQIKNGANPAKEIDRILASVEKKSNESNLQLKQEIKIAQKALNTETHGADVQQNTKVEAQKQSNETVKEVRQSIQAELNVQKAIYHVKNQIVEGLAIDQKTKQQVEKAVIEASRLLSMGQSGLAKEKLVQTLVALENNPATDEATDVQTRPTVTKMESATAPKSAEAPQTLTKTVEHAVQQIKNGTNPAREIEKVLSAVERKSVENHPQLRQEITQAQKTLELEQANGKILKDGNIEQSRQEAAIKQVRQAVQAESNTPKAVHLVKTQIVDNPDLDQTTKVQLEKAVTDANKLLSMGQSRLAKENLVQNLVKLENTLVKDNESVQSKSISAESSKNVSQSLSKTVEQAVQSIKSGAEPTNEMDKLLKAVEKKSAESSQQLKQEITNAKQVLNTEIQNGEDSKPEVQRANNQTTEAIKTARQTIQAEPNTQKAINHVKNQIVELSMGQSGLAKGKLVQTLVALENNPATDEAPEVQTRPTITKVNNSKALKSPEAPQPLTKTVEQAVQQIKNGANPAREIEKVLSAVERKSSLDQPQLRNEIIKAQQVLREGENHSKDASRPNTQAADVLKKLRQAVQSELNVAKAINHVKNHVADSHVLDLKTKLQLDKAVADSSKLLSFGQQGLAKGNLVQSLVALENQAVMDEMPKAPANNNAVIAGSSSFSKYGDANQPLAKTVEQSVQSIKAGANPVQEIDRVLKAIDRKSAESSQQLKHEITKAQTILTEAEGSPAKMANEESARNSSKVMDSFTKKMPQSLSRTVEHALQQIKNGSNPTKAMEMILPALEKETNQKIQQVKQEIVKAMQIQEAGKDRILQTVEEVSDAQTEKTAQKTPVLSLKEAIQQGTSMNETVQKLQQEVLNNTEMHADVKGRVNRAISEGTRLHQIGTDRLTEALNKLSSVSDETQIEESEQELLKLQSDLKEVQKEASMQKLLDKVGAIVNEHSMNENIDLTNFKSSTEKAQQLFAQGRELAARKMVAEAVTQLEKDHPVLQKSAEQPVLTEADQYAINETLHTLGLESKTLLVTEISKKLSQMAIDFKKVKQDITKNLDNISTMLDKKVNPAHAKQMLDTTINKLDNAILKSNFMLYTDMLTEKKMLTASSRLSEARNLLAKGELGQASQIVKEVKTMLDKIIFKPSETRVQHFVSEESLLKQPETTMEEHLTNGIKQAVKPMPDQDYSSRQVFESLKRLGLTHENDAANSLVFGSKGEQEELNNNLKSALIKMVQDGEGQSKADQALSNLTGQQLLNKQDPSGMQNLFFQMPFLLNQKMENIKVFINSQKSGDKIDWENCNLYFVLETKKLGEVGILVTAQNRNISITFNSKKENLEQTLEPLAEISAERLQEIGYKLDALKAKKPSEQGLGENVEEQQSKSLTPAFTEKGYDFSI